MLLSKPVIVCIAPALFLSACSSEQPDLDDAEILGRAERLTPPEPGQYRTTTALTAFELPGATAQEAERMRANFGFVEPQETQRCLTRAEAVRGFLPLVEAMQQGNCTFSRFNTSERRLDAAMRCEAVEGMRSEVTLLGEAGRQSSRLETSVVQRGDNLPGGELRFTMVVETQRLGDCPPVADGTEGSAPET